MRVRRGCDWVQSVSALVSAFVCCTSRHSSDAATQRRSDSDCDIDATQTLTADERLEEDDAEAPPVDGAAVARAVQHLGREVLGRAACVFVEGRGWEKRGVRVTAKRELQVVAPARGSPDAQPARGTARSNIGRPQ